MEVPSEKRPYECNPACHLVAGLKAAFGHKVFRKCRFCLATEEQIQSLYSYIHFIRRTQSDHEQYCNALLQASIAEHISMVYGVKFNSILNELSYFNVTYGCPPDIMHDLLEGVVPLTVSLLLVYCIKTKKYFSRINLNNMIKNFNYGYTEAVDKPCTVSSIQLKKKSIKGTASQKWLLAVCLPLMVGRKVAENDELWNCFLILLRICRIVFSDSATNFEVIMLGSHIHDFLSGFREHFQRELTFKMHNMVHYPELIKEFGPLGPFWTMRFEAKHSQMKAINHHTRNFINLPYTLSYRHQQWVANKYMACNGRMFTPTIKAPKSRFIHLSYLPYGGQVAIAFDLTAFPNNISRFSWIKINSTLFKVGQSVLLCPLKGAREAAFGLLRDIFCENGKYMFVCKIYQTKIFDEHLQAFCVTERTDKFNLVLSPFELIDFRVYTMHVPGFVKPIELGMSRYVVPKTNILNCSN